MGEEGEKERARERKSLVVIVIKIAVQLRALISIQSFINLSLLGGILLASDQKIKHLIGTS